MHVRNKSKLSEHSLTVAVFTKLLTQVLSIVPLPSFLSRLMNAEHLVVKDVSRKQANWLRRSLLPSLLGVLKTNLNAKNTPCEIFEIAATFAPAKAGQLPVERTILALVCDGQLRDITGAIEGLIKSINKDAEVAFAPAQLVWAQAGAQILVNGSSIGQAGIVSRKVKDKFDFKDCSCCRRN